MKAFLNLSSTFRFHTSYTQWTPKLQEKHNTTTEECRAKEAALAETPDTESQAELPTVHIGGWLETCWFGFQAWVKEIEFGPGFIVKEYVALLPVEPESLPSS